MNRKALFTIFMIILTDIIGFGIIIPLLPTISENLGINGFALGLLTASYAIAQFISSPILGFLSDKYGRKPILVISKAGTVVAYVMLAFSRSYLLIIASRLIDGFTGGNIPAARAYISDVTTKENRAKGMAIIGIAFGLGFIIGPAIGGIFYTIGHSQTLPGLVGAGLSLFSLILTQLFLDESHRDGKIIHHRQFSIKTFFDIFQRPVVGQILATVFITMIVISGLQTTIPFFTTAVFKFTTENNSWMLVFLGVLGLIIQGGIIRRVSHDNSLMSRLGIWLSAIGIVLIALSPNPIFLFSTLAAYSAGSSFIQVFLPALLSTSSSTDPEGEIMGAYEGVSSLGRVIGPAIFGSLVLTQARPTYLISAFVLLASLYFLPKPHHSQPNQSGDN